MTRETNSEYVVEQFTLEESTFGDMARLIDNAFNPKNKGGTIAFDEKTLRLIFGCPYLSQDLFVRVIHTPTGETVGFTGGIPRNLAYGDKIYQFGVPTFQSVHRDHQRKGLAVKMNLKLIETGQSMGFDGGFASYEPEAHGIDAVLRVVEDHGLKMQQMLKIKQFIVRVWNVKEMAPVVPLKPLEKIWMTLRQGIKKLTNPQVRAFQPEDADQIFALMQDHIEHNELAVVREKKEFTWYLNQPNVNCVVHEDHEGKIDGFMVAWQMNLAGFGHSVPFGWLDTVHLYRLPLKEAADLCNFMCHTAREKGWVGLQTPYIPYFDPKPLKKAKFIFYPKKLLVNLYFLNSIPFPESVDSFYFDWR